MISPDSDLAVWGDFLAWYKNTCLEGKNNEKDN